MKNYSVFWNFLKTILAVFLAFASLLWVPLTHRIPLYTIDTMAYYYGAIGFNVFNAYRPIWYGFFLNWVSGYSFHALAVLQVLVVYLFLLRMNFLTTGLSLFVTSVIVAFMGIATAASASIVLLVPDFLAPCLFCGFILVIYQKSKWDGWIGTLAILIAVMFHYSFIPIAIITALGIYIFGKMKIAFQYNNFQKPLFIMMAILISLLLLNTVISGGKPRLSNSASGFLLNRLIYFGLVQKYLIKKCIIGNEEQFCQYRNELPIGEADFFWRKNSPIDKLGGWTNNNYLYYISFQTLMYFPLESIQRFVESGLRQLITFKRFTGHMKSFTVHHGNLLFKKNNTLVIAKLKGKDMFTLDGPPLFFLQRWLVYGSIAGMILAIFTKQGIRKCRDYFILILWFCVVNGMVCGMFSTVANRYQSRVIWLIPFLFLSQLIDKIKNFDLSYVSLKKIEN